MPQWSEPVKHTCPDIDALIDSMCDMGRDAEKAMKDIMSGIDEFCTHARAELEKLRSANDSLRTWGRDWRDEAERIEREALDTEREAVEAQQLADSWEQQYNALEEVVDRLQQENETLAAELQETERVLLSE